jgi:hypothetical protein
MRLRLPSAGAVLIVLACARGAAGQPAPSPRPPPSPLLESVKAAAGAAAGLAVHEGGHVMMALALGAHPHTHRAYIGGAPFFAIVHRGVLSPKREFGIAAAGFWVQELTNERLLARRTALRGHRAPFATGLFAFNELTSIGYGIVALARVGPASDRVIDTRAMAGALRVNEPLVGGFILAPALIDGYRYFHPDSRWARWASRFAKTGTVFLLFR